MMILSQINAIRRLMKYHVPLLQIIFGGMTLGVFVFGFLINTAEKHLPAQLIAVYKYGKLADKRTTPIIKTVPKSWFRHFYIVGVVWSGLTLAMLYSVSAKGENPSWWFITILDLFTPNRLNSSGTEVAAFLGIFLLFTHCCIRLLEVIFISVYSSSRINVIHYISGILHYIGAVIAIVAEAPTFSEETEDSTISWTYLTTVDYVGLFIFFLASYCQLQSSIILANLRKNEKGEVITYKHLIPRGGLFEYVTSPHIVSEIIIYLALTIVMRTNRTWWFVFFWVLVNQSEAALLNHWWYKEKFSNYPKSRKAIIPFLL